MRIIIGLMSRIHLKLAVLTIQRTRIFEINNQRGTFVYRWEYQPGSLLYVVYNLNDNNYYSDQDGEWSQSKSNSLFLKFDYFFQS